MFARSIPALVRQVQLAVAAGALTPRHEALLLPAGGAAGDLRDEWPLESATPHARPIRCSPDCLATFVGSYGEIERRR